MLRVLVTGANGQVGWELLRTAPDYVSVTFLERVKLDISNEEQVKLAFDEIQPQVVVNAAAYTAVDRAESEPDIAFSINHNGAENIARVALEQSARMIHLSTDYVFDGRKSNPYLPEDVPRPLNIYGASKLAGDIAVQTILNGAAFVLRTAWVYSVHGHNFVKTILRLCKEQDQIRVISDQVGTPTSANGLARAIWGVVGKPELNGLYHWTDAGIASWYDFAVAIQDIALEFGLLERAVRIVPVNSDQYRTPAKRPIYSVLDKTRTWEALDRIPPHWRAALYDMLSEGKSAW